MKRAQRIVVILYCLLLTYCFVWIPWHEPARHFAEGAIRPAEDLGYGWLWAVPDSYAAPDLQRMALRFVAATAVAAAFFFMAGLWRSARPR
jgi:hypothetical protein